MMPTWPKYLAPHLRAARAVRTSPARRWPRPFRPMLEQLERRDTPALQLLYGGPGTALTLSEVGAAAADTVTAETLAVAGAVNTSAGAAGSVTLNVDDLAIPAAGSINSGARAVTVQPQSAARAIDLGTDTAGKLGLTAAEFNRVTAGQFIV